MQKTLNVEKITFKVVQMKFLAMHITIQKLCFYIFTVANLQKNPHGTWFLLNILMIFSAREIHNCDPYNVCLAIATNIPVQLMTDFVVRGHKL